MGTGYFHEVRSRIGTELWINNPSGSDIQVALANGAVGVASNPSYITALLKSEPDFVHATVREVTDRAVVGADDEALAMDVIRKTVSRPLNAFHELYQRTEGRYGHTAIQGSPRRNHDLSAILEEAETFHDLGENIIIKVPSTVEGAQAMEELTARGWPTIGTISFSVSQYVFMAEAHHRGLQRTDAKPRCLITMLPGMFDEYLAEDAARRGIKVSPEVLCEAGISTARAAWAVYRERNYEAIVLSGGARFTRHFTELAVPDFGITLSGALTRALIEEHPAVIDRADAAAPQAVIAELRDKFPEFVRACDVDALAPETFRSYGPCVRFQNSLTDGFTTIVELIQARRRGATND